jgi:antitoxin CptB
VSEGAQPDQSDRQDQGTDGAPGGVMLDPVDLNKLKWRCRRGLLENDLFIERFFRRHEETLTVDQAAGLQRLTDLADNDLLDLLLARREPEGDLDRADVREVLALIRTAERRH